MSKAAKKEPLLRVVKRDYAGPAHQIGVRLAAVLLAALVTNLFILAITGFGFGTTITTMFSAVFGTANRFHSFLQEMCLLLLIAVGLAPAFKMRFWNIGAQGQVLIGGIATAILMYYIRDRLPAPVLIALMVVTSVVTAGLWLLIPAFFNVKFGTNATLFTLMMNYIAIQIVRCFTQVWKGSKSSFGLIDRFTGSKNGYFSALFGMKTGWLYLIALVLTFAMYIYMAKTKHGYEITVVGESVNTARYAGINDKKVILRTAFISGGVCGLVGLLYVANISHTISASTGGGYGFTAIIVAWLGGFNPVLMTLISALLTFLSKGAGDIRNAAGLDDSVCNVVVCIFLFFILGSEFFVKYRLIFKKKQEQEDQTVIKTKVVK